MNPIGIWNRKIHWQEHNALGESLIGGLKSAGVKIFSSGSMEMDLTQTSFSTVPSIDIELGDRYRIILKELF